MNLEDLFKEAPMTIDRTYPIFTVRWLAVHGLAVPTVSHIENGLQNAGYVHRPRQIYENDIKICFCRQLSGHLAIPAGSTYRRSRHDADGTGGRHLF